MWCSFIFGVGLTVLNMVMGFAGTPLIASPINCGAICMVVSLILVPVVSAFTRSVPFDVKPPSPLGEIDRKFMESEVSAPVPPEGDTFDDLAAEIGGEGAAADLAAGMVDKREVDKFKE